MNADKLASSKTGGYLVLGLLVVGAVWYLTSKAKSAALALANVNAGTPYAGTGAIGTLGHAADAASGGVLSSVGNWLGGGLYNLTLPAYDPNSIAPDANTPAINSGIWGNPVSQAPTVLPYSYKQSIIDNPALLGTDKLFTPSRTGSGASGGWAESGGMGAGGSLDTTGYTDYLGNLH